MRMRLYDVKRIWCMGHAAKGKGLHGSRLRGCMQGFKIENLG